MKNVKTLLNLTLTALIIFVCTKAQAKTLFGDYFKDLGVETSVEAAVSYYDKYVWRGFLLDNDSVMQPEFTITAGPIEGGFWGSWDLESHDVLASDEVDGWVGYNFDLEFLHEELNMVGVSVGHTWYDFPEASAYAKELYFTVAVDTFLSPYFTLYHDYSEESQGGADGNYYMFGAGHSFTLNEEYGITLDLGQEIGINNDAFIVGTGVYSLTTIGTTIPISDNISMAPSIGYSIPFGDLDEGGGNDQNDEFYGGVTMSFTM